MANLEIEGKISQKLQIVSGQSARGEWRKQDFVVEFPDGNFTSQACFTAFGDDRVNELGRFQVGDMVKVSFNVRAREYNGRWYNYLRPWRISPVGESAPAGQAPQGFRQTSPAGPQTVPAPGLADIPAESSDDDLPF